MPRPKVSELKQFLDEASVTYIVQKCSLAIEDQWLRQFSQPLKRATGHYKSGKFKWHTFSGGYYPSVSGDEAIDLYLAQRPSEFIIFDENPSYLFTCEGSAYPDLSDLGSDLYVCHISFKWTMAFTHEQPWLGPYFATTPN